MGSTHSQVRRRLLLTQPAASRIEHPDCTSVMVLFRQWMCVGNLRSRTWNAQSVGSPRVTDRRPTSDAVTVLVRRLSGGERSAARNRRSDWSLHW
jgi:hypothetical protein